MVKKRKEKKIEIGYSTSRQSCRLLWDRSSSITWEQKAAISPWSPALLIPQPLNTSTLGRFSRSGVREQDKAEINEDESDCWGIKTSKTTDLFFSGVKVS